MGYTAAAVAAVDGDAVRRLEVERLVVVDGRLPLVVRARGDLVVHERRLVIVVVARAVSEHGGDGAVGSRVDVRGAVGAGERACLRDVYSTPKLTNGHVCGGIGVSTKSDIFRPRPVCR